MSIQRNKCTCIECGEIRARIEQAEEDFLNVEGSKEGEFNKVGKPVSKSSARSKAGKGKNKGVKRWRYMHDIEDLVGKTNKYNKEQAKAIKLIKKIKVDHQKLQMAHNQKETLPVEICKMVLKTLEVGIELGLIQRNSVAEQKAKEKTKEIFKKSSEEDK